MFSILDILKKQREEKKKGAEAQAASPSQPSPASIFYNDEAYAAASVSSALSKEQLEEGMRKMGKLYDDAVALCRKIYTTQGVDQAVVKEELDPLLDRVIAELSSGSRASLRFFLKEYPALNDYLYYHAVNVCMLTVEFGLGLSYEPAALHDLAKSAFLHDIGMAAFTEIARKPGPLAPEELAMIRLHPEKGVHLGTISGFGPGVGNALLQEHERFDGTGYGKGLKGADICEPARAIGLADVYEAMVHSRPFRPAYSPSAAMNAILNNKSAFDPQLVKVLIERVGIFPEGTMVRLNTKETAVVVKINPLSPLRPVVSVIADAQGNELKAPKEINLCKNYLIHIEEKPAVSER